MKVVWALSIEVFRLFKWCTLDSVGIYEYIHITQNTKTAALEYWIMYWLVAVYDVARLHKKMYRFVVTQDS